MPFVSKRQPSTLAFVNNPVETAVIQTVMFSKSVILSAFISWLLPPPSPVQTHRFRFLSSHQPGLSFVLVFRLLRVWLVGIPSGWPLCPCGVSPGLLCREVTSWRDEMFRLLPCFLRHRRANQRSFPVVEALRGPASGGRRAHPGDLSASVPVSLLWSLIWFRFSQLK